MYSAKHISQVVLTVHSSLMSPMKLQKLLFFIQSWHLKKFGERIIDDNFERWKHGPVIPSIFYEYPGHEEIPRPPTPESLNPVSFELIKKVCAVYGKYTGWQLSWITKQPGTAFSRSSARVMTDEDLREGKV